MNEEELKSFWERTEDKGSILYAGVEGSRQYNVAGENSDTDFMAVMCESVHRAVGEEILWGSAKTLAGETPDISYHEASKVTELLFEKADSRVVEAVLATQANKYLHADPAWTKFWSDDENWKQLLTVKYLDSYLTEAEGNKGLHNIRRMHELNPSETAKLNKKWYIVIRILLTALTLVTGSGTPMLEFTGCFRTFLIRIRAGCYPHESLLQTYLSLVAEISRRKAGSETPPQPCDFHTGIPELEDIISGLCRTPVVPLLKETPNQLRKSFEELVIRCRGVVNIHPDPPTTLTSNIFLRYKEISSGKEITVVRGQTGPHILQHGRIPVDGDLAGFVRSMKMGRISVCGLFLCDDLILMRSPEWEDTTAALRAAVVSSPLVLFNALSVAKSVVHKLTRPKLKLTVPSFSLPTLQRIFAVLLPELLPDTPVHEILEKFAPSKGSNNNNNNNNNEETDSVFSSEVSRWFATQQTKGLDLAPL